MKILYGLSKVEKFPNPVVVLGVFDGVHLAHKRILQEVVSKAAQAGGRSILVTFWPHPREKESLYSLEHRLKLIAGFKIDVCIVIRFNPAFSRISAENFVKNILVEKIGAEYIYIGKNFTFGKGARGDYLLLRKLSGVYNFKLKVFSVIRINHQPVSSTYIRRLIKSARLKRAQRLLGRPVSILGTVIKGASQANRLGFPTANINPHHEVLPPAGVYAVEVIYQQKKFNGVCSIGTKPTFETKRLQHIEVHIFNFCRNIYGKFLEIQFIKKIRNQKKFTSPSALAEEIKKDIIQSKSIFSLP